MKLSDKIWNFIAPAYNLIRENPVSGYFLRKELEGINSLLKNIVDDDIDRACDLGVGRGHSLQIIPEMVTQRIAIDKSLAMIHYTKDNHAGTQLIAADVLHLPIKETSFDLIICIGLMEYISELEQLIEQIHHSLRDKGFLLITSSPKKFLTFMRTINGHKIYPRSKMEVEKYLTATQFNIKDVNITTSQIQFLSQKMLNG